MQEEKHYGNYLGIVVQNNDPDQYGRVKIFIPHLTPIVYSSWFDQDKDRAIQSIIGGNINDDSMPILNELKQILPWAECAAPLVGESATGRFNDYYKFGSASESNFLSTLVTTTTGLSTTKIGNSPSYLYDKEVNISDAFTSASDNINRPNPLSYNYTPNSYNNAAKGAFAIPAVGSHIWVFFREGNIQFPVYFAASFGQQDWQSVFLSAGDVDYPGTYENRSSTLTAVDTNVSTYRNKYVINQKGGALEFVNSDLNEKVKLSHYTGSHFEMNNKATIELATANKNTLILNDAYSTTKGFKNDYTGKNLDEIVERDKYKKVGSLNLDKFKEWKDNVAPIQEFKQLFEIKRTGNNSVANADGVTVLKRNSELQEQDGSFVSNPVVDGTLQYSTLAGQTIDSPSSLDEDYSSTVTSPGDNGPGGTLDGTDDAAANANPAAPTEPELSPSTQDGTWVIDERKDQLKELVESSIEELTKIEQDLGIGGSEITQITKNKVETIGMLMNDFGSYRLDPIGKLTGSEVKVDSTSVYLNKEGSPMLEYTHVQDLPGGTSTLNVSNRYNVLVGAGGLNLKSYGPTNITGSITNITGEQVNMGSDNEINIDAEVINISADILTMRNKRQKQVLIDSNLGIQKNVVIGGGLHVEGELFLQHVTAPREYQLTEPVVLYGELVSGKRIGTDADGSAVSAFTTSNSVKIYSHSHAFANLPLSLTDTNTGLRTASNSSGITSTSRVVATRRDNSRK